MKITIESYAGQPEERKVSLELPDEADAVELADAFYRLGIAMTYHPNSILNGFNSVLEEQEYFLTDKDEGIGETNE